MLILNNGVQKSGSSLVQKLLQKALKPAVPGDEWQREGWTNPSVPPEKLKAYYKSDEWRKHPVLLKTHLRFQPSLRYLAADRKVRVVISRRNLPDTVVSYFHHQVRRGEARAKDKAIWMNTVGRTRAFAAVSYQTSWRHQPNCHFVRYEDLLETPLPALTGMLTFLGHELPDERCKKIVNTTILGLGKTLDLRDGQFVRTAAGAAPKRSSRAPFSKS